MSKSNLTIASKLVAADLLIENTLTNPLILEQVTARGYPISALAEGQQLQRVANAAVDAQAAAAGAARLATKQALVAERQARKAYQALAQTARAVFPPNSPQHTALHLAGSKTNSAITFIAAASTLFNNAQNIGEISEVLSRYGYDAVTLERERGLIMAYQRALRAQASAKSGAKAATEAQTEALEALQYWTRQYRKIAKIALREQPNLLKALGLAFPGKRAATTSKARVEAEAV